MLGARPAQPIEGGHQIFGEPSADKHSWSCSPGILGAGEAAPIHDLAAPIRVITPYSRDFGAVLGVPLQWLWEVIPAVSLPVNNENRVTVAAHGMLGCQESAAVGGAAHGDVHARFQEAITSASR